MTKKYLPYLPLGLAILASSQVASAATVTVTNTNNTGTGSLRAAITSANATPGTTIEFNIATAPTGGIWTISPSTALPALTANGTIIDGTTQTTNQGDTNTAGPEIAITGTGAGVSAAGLRIGADSCVIKNLIINGFDGYGIDISSDWNAAHTNPQSNAVYGCYIGTNASGTAEWSNFSGVEIFNADYTLIGGATAATRNVLSGNEYHGVGLYGLSSYNVIQGNYIGTNAAGTGQVGNHHEGISTNYTAGAPVSYVGQNLIGGTATGARNVISGNWGTSNIDVIGARDLSIQNNNIGTAADGNSALTPGPTGFNSPQQRGILFGANNDPSTVGGTTAAARNVIGYHAESGIQMDGSVKVTIQGNSIGLGRDNTTNIGNAYGIAAFNASEITVGGASAGSGNIITNSGAAGVAVVNYTEMDDQVSIRGNSIYANTGMGIDLGGDGLVQANDTLDPDSGANRLQNFPVITAAASNAGGSTALGTLNTTASTSFRLDFYEVTTPDAGGYGEGRVYLGQYAGTTNASGNASFNFPGPPVTVGRYITATCTSGGRTSEFSLARQVAATLPSLKIAAPSSEKTF